MKEEKKIAVSYKPSGELRLLEPIRQHSIKGMDASVAPTISSSLESESQKTLEVTKPQTDKNEVAENTPFGRSEVEVQSKNKREITNLEQLIEYAYGRKGQTLSFKENVLREISRNTQVTAEGLAALQKPSKDDPQFAVPRQILLAAQEIDGYPTIRQALLNFVQTAMLCHPIFRNPQVIASIRNLPESPSPHTALKLVMDGDFQKHYLDDKDIQKRDSEKIKKRAVGLDSLRANATNCLAVWFAVTRHLSIEEVTEALNNGFWASAAMIPRLDIEKLRALTDILKIDGIGLACELYRRKAISDANTAVQAISEASELRATLAETLDKMEQTTIALEETTSDFKKFKILSSKDQENLKQDNETQSAHLRDDIEQLKSRFLRRMLEDIEMLSVGLSAIQGPAPKTHVIHDRVERVIDELQKEINRLRENSLYDSYRL